MVQRGVTVQIHLLDLSNVSCDVLHCDRIFNVETMALALDASLVNQHSRIGSKS